MNHHFNRLTPAEAERLALLLEEMGEAQQLIGKILRHGYESFHPDDDKETPNRRLLEKEVGDVMASLDLLYAANDLRIEHTEQARRRKHEKVHRYLHHQPRPEYSFPNAASTTTRTK